MAAQTWLEGPSGRHRAGAHHLFVNEGDKTMCWARIRLEPGVSQQRPNRDAGWMGHREKQPFRGPRKRHQGCALTHTTCGHQMTPREDPPLPTVGPAWYWVQGAGGWIGSGNLKGEVTVVLDGKALFLQ